MTASSEAPDAARAGALLLAALTAAPDGIGLVENGRLIYANPSLSALLAVGRVAAGTRSFEPSTYLIDRAMLLLSRRETRFTDRIIVESDSGRRTLAFHITRADLDGRLLAAVFVRDASEQARAEERLARADRLASLGQLAAGVAHEVNNPLACVLGNLDIATERLTAAPDSAENLGERRSEIAEAVANAKEGAERVRRIVRELMAFSKPEVEGREVVNVESVLDSTVKLAWNEIRHRARLLKRYSGVSLVRGDEARIGQVFLNLIMNAAYALEARTNADAEIALATSEEGDRVVVEISDTGAGIADEDLPHVFEPFFTTKAAGKGMGLGLAICQSIVLAHGGNIAVESRRGGGSTFRVALPRARAGAAVPAPSVEVERPRTTGARILVVDDEPLLGQTLSFAFRGKHEVIVAVSGREALARLAVDSRYDLVLCDLMMPDVSGQNVFEAVRRDHPELLSRFVFMTGGAFTERAQEFLEQHSGRTIEKPFSMTEIERVLDELR
ncbi:MAG TPA: ATP-binding protein [Polyangiaceae bacterium]|nr:ATP-binding protein [Polyangiaceae bacterium]